MARDDVEDNDATDEIQKVGGSTEQELYDRKICW